MTQSALLLRVTLREEGSHFYAASPDLPGLHVCGSSKEETCESVIRAVKFLFKRNRDMDVVVAPATSDVDAFPKAVEACNQFVVQRELLAA